jgi:hypothetical protein
MDGAMGALIVEVRSYKYTHHTQNKKIQIFINLKKYKKIQIFINLKKYKKIQIFANIKIKNGIMTICQRSKWAVRQSSFRMQKRVERFQDTDLVDLSSLSKCLR